MKVLTLPFRNLGATLVDWRFWLWGMIMTVPILLCYPPESDAARAFFPLTCLVALITMSYIFVTEIFFHHNRNPKTWMLVLSLMLLAFITSMVIGYELNKELNRIPIDDPDIGQEVFWGLMFLTFVVPVMCFVAGIIYFVTLRRVATFKSLFRRNQGHVYPATQSHSSAKCNNSAES